MIARAAAIAAVVLAGMLYVGNAWSPSSYGVVLTQLGVPEAGPLLGRARHVRSDEYAVVTPLTQATVRNGFERYNRTSLYGEDLRINYGLPIRDWGLAFKPTMWLYGIVDAAHAYSFHWYATTILFVVGHALLLRWLGATAPVAWLLSAGLFFTGFVQFWWSEKASVFALFPWVLLPFATRLRFGLQLVAFWWAATAWLLTNFYPPMQIPLAFVGAALLAAREPRLVARAPAFAIAVAAALCMGTVVTYLWDYLQATHATHYPGLRRAHGGQVDGALWLSWLFPTINIGDDFVPRHGDNIVDLGTVGLAYTLAALAFLDYSRWRALRDHVVARRLVACGTCALAAMVAWMALPVPSAAGAALLWNYVPPLRMQYPAGLLLVAILAVAAGALGFRVTVARAAIYAATVAIVTVSSAGDSSTSQLRDLAAVALVVATFAIAWRNRERLHASLAAASLAAGVAWFGGYNPLQDARAIFSPPAGPWTAALDHLAARDGALSISGLPGAAANGLGYRSVGHVLAAPRIDYWRQRYPTLADDEIDRLFNRYVHVMPAPSRTPMLARFDAVFVPARAAEDSVRYVETTGGVEATGGQIDAFRLDRGALVVTGWLPSGDGADAPIDLVVEPPAAGPAARTLELRGDLPKALGRDDALLTGFALAIPLTSQLSAPALCAFAYDARGVRVLLGNPPGLRYCSERRAMAVPPN